MSGRGQVKHGHAVGGKVSGEYRAWQNMKERCLRTTNVRYKDYGGRGITVCSRWMKFENFLADMGLRPSGLTLERKDNDGNYEPSNCMWATLSAQMKNRRMTERFRKAQQTRKREQRRKRSGLPRGVDFVKDLGKYVARMTVPGSGCNGKKSRKKYLGLFATAKQAARCVRRAECASA